MLNKIYDSDRIKCKKKMTTPNWQHNSGKPQKRTLKPQALRQAKKRRGQLIKCLLNRPKGGFVVIIGI